MGRPSGGAACGTVLSVTAQTLWHEIYNRFDPMRPVGTERPEWRVERPGALTELILRQLEAPFGQPHILYLGTVGVGKSTELMRISEARAATDFVVYLDLVQHFDEVVGDGYALHAVQAWEICLLVGLAVLRAAEVRFGHAWEEGEVEALASAWREAATRTGTAEPSAVKEIDLLGVSRSLLLLASDVLPGAGTALKAVDALRTTTRLPISVGKRHLPDQEGPARRLLEAVNRLIARVHSEYGREVLLAIDGLDRVDEPARALSIFVESRLLGRLDARVVMPGPLALRFSQDAARVQGFEVRTLTNIPVLDHGSPPAPSGSTQVLRELYARRVAGLAPDALVDDGQLERLAWASGGRARSFVKLVRNLAYYGHSEGVSQISDEHVEAVVDEARLELERGVTRDDIDVLEAVARDPDHRLPGGNRAHELLLGGRLLPFPNESEWYYPHPLLTLSLLKARPTG